MPASRRIWAEGGIEFKSEKRIALAPVGALVRPSQNGIGRSPDSFARETVGKKFTSLRGISAPRRRARSSLVRHFVAMR
jgi:hypothetical protein